MGTVALSGGRLPDRPAQSLAPPRDEAQYGAPAASSGPDWGGCIGLLDCPSRDLRAHRAEGQAEGIILHARESGALDGRPRLAIGVASVSDSLPHRTNEALHSAQTRSCGSRNVFQKHKPPARLQHPPNLSQNRFQITDRAENQRAYHSVHTLIFCGQLFSDDGPNIDGDSRSYCGLAKVRMHEEIRFDPDPAATGWVVNEIGSCTWTDLQDVPAQICEQRPLAFGHQAFITRPAGGQQPSMHALSKPRFDGSFVEGHWRWVVSAHEVALKNGAPSPAHAFGRLRYCSRFAAASRMASWITTVGLISSTSGANEPAPPAGATR